MSIFNFFNKNKYTNHPDAVIISCFFNPMKSLYRLAAFNKFYDSIKHLNHEIVECVIGSDSPQLPENKNIERVYTENLLWHKESLLNNIVKNLPAKYKYVFWIDADVMFTNKNWLKESVEKLQTQYIIQPFEYCMHLEKDETRPSFNIDDAKKEVNNIQNRNNIQSKDRRVWRSFSANYATTSLSKSSNYDVHGHVGFAWGARRNVLDKIPLYDKALIGGADHIVAHAAAGQIPHSCIERSFTDNINEINEWSRKFYDVVRGKIGYAKGDLYHIWHGDVGKREYFKRIKDFTEKSKVITAKDKNGLYITGKEDDKYVTNYFRNREVLPDRSYNRTYQTHSDDGFLTSMAMGYMTDSMLLGTLIGGHMPGALVGQMLRDSSDNHSHNETRRNSETNWSAQENNNHVNTNRDYIPSININNNDNNTNNTNNIDSDYNNTNDVPLNIPADNPNVCVSPDEPNFS